MCINYQVLFRACDKVESVHRVKRPFGLNKIQTIKVSFYSMYRSLQGYNYQFTVIGDDLSQELLDFFRVFNDVVVDNDGLGSASRSLQKQIALSLQSPQDTWVYMCEDDYLHVPDAFKYISEFIDNKHRYLKTTSANKNYMNRIIGDLSGVPLIIHPPDYPDRYRASWRRLSFLFLSKYCHWRQVSNTTHTFLLQGGTIRKFEKHINDSAVGPSDSKLSEKVYGRIFFKNRALCVSPIKGLSTHLTEGVITPLVDWEMICGDIIRELKDKDLWK